VNPIPIRPDHCIICRRVLTVTDQQEGMRTTSGMICAADHEQLRTLQPYDEELASGFWLDFLTPPAPAPRPAAWSGWQFWFMFTVTLVAVTSALIWGT
jgi:hypothetical protein